MYFYRNSNEMCIFKCVYIKKSCFSLHLSFKIIYLLLKWLFLLFTIYCSNDYINKISSKSSHFLYSVCYVKPGLFLENEWMKSSSFLLALGKNHYQHEGHQSAPKNIIKVIWIVYSNISYCITLFQNICYVFV